ncbi:MAG TPA: adenosylhomocysteinase, partial [Gaiellaceae bacterium]
VITATGGVDSLPADALPHLKDKAILANAGHQDREIAVDALGPGEEVRAGVTQHDVGGKRVYLCVGGSLVNIAGGDGNPVEIMDLSFSVQALAAHLLAQGTLPPGLHRLPAELDREIARTKLATLGVELDDLTATQKEFSAQWTV